MKACVGPQSHRALRTLCEGPWPGCLQAQHPCWGYTMCEGHQKVLLEQGPLLDIFQCPLPPSTQSLMSQPAPWHMVHARMRLARSPRSPFPTVPGRLERSASTLGNAATSLQSKAAKNTLQASER